MALMIIYDIESNKFRARLAKVILARGAVRIQKSVYFFQGDMRIFQPTRQRLERWMEEFADPGDKLFLLPVNEESVERMIMMGLKMDLGILLGRGLIIV